MSYSPTPLPIPDFRRLFEAAPGSYLVLAADLTIVAVSDAYLGATSTQRADLLGRHVFDVFSDDAFSDDVSSNDISSGHLSEPNSGGLHNLRTSFERVLRDGVVDTMPVQQYGFYRSPVPSVLVDHSVEQPNQSERRYWKLVNSPVFEASSEVSGETSGELSGESSKPEGDRVVTHIIHHAEAVAIEPQPKRLKTGEAILHAALAQENISKVLESITDAFVSFDQYWRYTHINQEAAQLLQVDSGALLGVEVWHDDVASSLSKLCELEMREAVREQVSLEFETFSTALNLWLAIWAYPTANGLAVYFRDITAAKQEALLQEQNAIQLQEHQRLLQQVTDTVPGVLYVYDWIEQQTIYISGQVANNLGFTPEQIYEMGSSVVLQLVHPDDLKKLSVYIQQFWTLQDGEVIETEYRLRRASGEWRWFTGRELVFSRTVAGVPKQILGTAYDITLRKRTEEALRLEKERFELAATAVDCLIYDWNVETGVTERSDGLTRIFGYAPDQAESTRDWWIDHIHPDDVPLLSEQMLENLAKSDRFAVEYRLRHQTQQHRYVLDQGTVVRDARGRAVRVVGTITDISDRKITEALQQFLLKLNDAIRTLPDAQAIIQLMVQEVGQYFDITRCSYAEINLAQTYATVDLDFFNGVASLSGKHRLNHFDPAIVALLKQGKTVAVEDVQTDLRTLSCKAGLAALDTRSLLCVPLVKQERFVALLMLHHVQPRSWSAKEIALIEDVADRTWIAIEKAQAERALRHSEARFQRLAHNVPGVIYRYLLHADGTDSMLYISPGCRSLFELDAETIQGDMSSLWQLVHPDDVEALRDIIAVSAQTQQPIHWEGQYVLPSGCTKWIQMVARPEQQADSSVFWDGLLTDITGTKEVELERERLLTRSQHYAAQLRGLTAAALEMNSVLSVEEVLQTITKEAYSIIGAHQSVTSVPTNQDWSHAISAVHLSDKYAQWRECAANPDGAGTYAHLRQIERPIRMTQAELEIHPQWRASGLVSANYPPMRGWLAAPLTGRNGHNIGLIQLSDKYEGEFTTEDEAILVQLAQMASVAVENTRLYEAQQAARAQAEAMNRIKDEFLAVLSHELRSPLNPILGWSRLMQTRNLNPQTAAYALETIERNAKLQTQLIEDLLDVSRILQGKMSLNVAPVDLATTIEAAIETVHLAATAKSIHIRTVLDPHVGQVLGDSTRLQQIVWNLLSNSVKFTPVGGQVEIKLEQAGAQAHLRVTDTGKGIDADFLPHIFDYFRQEDGATTRRFGGLGLGLAIVRHIVELHGGVVQAASSGEGQGATFLVQLPLVKLQATTTDENIGDLTAEGDAVLPNSLQKLRILLVDDQQDSREVITFVLEQAGLKVTAVTSAQEALQVLSHQVSHSQNGHLQPTIDVLISDIGMPEVDGYMLMAQIKSQFSDSTQPSAIAPKIPKAIALTAYAGELDRQRALAAGFQSHVAKPFEPATLIAAIASVVSAPS